MTLVGRGRSWQVGEVGCDYGRRYLKHFWGSHGAVELAGWGIIVDVRRILDRGSDGHRPAAERLFAPGTQTGSDLAAIHFLAVLDFKKCPWRSVSSERPSHVDFAWTRPADPVYWVGAGRFSPQAKSGLPHSRL